MSGDVENSTAIFEPYGAESVALDRLVRMENYFHAIARRIKWQRRVSTAHLPEILPRSSGGFARFLDPVEYLIRVRTIPLIT